MYNRKWKWKKGRLWEPGNTGMSLSISEAYHMIPKHEAIREACKGVLTTYNKFEDDLRY